MWHHMGTTRMSDSPHDGVVDSDCKVHGMLNLYVAGSSVFPTCSNDMPTLTLMALAHRLADHLQSRASAGDRADSIVVWSGATAIRRPLRASSHARLSKTLPLD